MFDRWMHNRWVRNRYTRRLAHWVRWTYKLLFGPDTVAPQAVSPAQGGVPPMPTWLQDEVLKLAAMEPELLPPGTGLDRYAFYSVPMDVRLGDVYTALSDQIGAHPYTHVLLVPWLKPGGADRGILYHARAIAAVDPSARILVLTTENSPSPWSSRLPGSATLVEFGKLASSLDFSQQVAVMVRVLVQLRAPVIHLVNSRVGWEVVLRHGLALNQYSRVFASIYCDDYDLRMNPVGYARDYLRYCYPSLATVISDNSRYPQIWSRELGVPASSFTVIPFPYDGIIPELPITAISAPGAGRVLWAGRLDRQKRPDLLAAIAAAMPTVHFDVYGSPVMAEAAAKDLDALKSLSNVTLHGEFQRLEEVATSQHFAYLHTTGWEGTPTILFDVAAARLPICAPAVGGIVDFLDESELVVDPEDVAAFVQQLEALRDSEQARQQRVARQRESLDQQRKWPVFCARLLQLDGYVVPGPAAHPAAGQDNA